MPENIGRPVSKLVDDLQSDDKEVRDAASRILVARGGADVVDSLVSVLRSPDGWVRNGAASVLREIADDRAVDPLVDAINVPENCNNRGSLVYALQTLDCRNYFLFLFGLVIEGNYEVRSLALMILEEQQFDVTPAMLATAKNKLDAYVSRKDIRPEDKYVANELQVVFVNMSDKP